MTNFADDYSKIFHQQMSEGHTVLKARILVLQTFERAVKPHWAARAPGGGSQSASRFGSERLVFHAAAAHARVAAPARICVTLARGSARAL